MSYGRIASTAAKAVLKASPVGGALRSAKKIVTSIFGGGTDPWGKSLRETKSAARQGDVALLKHKLANSKYWQVRQAANQALIRLNSSQSIGAAPAGVMAVGGGTAGMVTKRRKPVSRAAPARRRKAAKRRTRSKSKSGWVMYKGRRYSPKQARIFVPSKRR